MGSKQQGEHLLCCSQLGSSCGRTSPALHQPYSAAMTRQPLRQNSGKSFPEQPTPSTGQHQQYSSHSNWVTFTHQQQCRSSPSAPALCNSCCPPPPWADVWSVSCKVLAARGYKQGAELSGGDSQLGAAANALPCLTRLSHGSSLQVTATFGNCRMLFTTTVDAHSCLCSAGKQVPGTFVSKLGTNYSTYAASCSHYRRNTAVTTVPRIHSCDQRTNSHHHSTHHSYHHSIGRTLVSSSIKRNDQCSVLSNQDRLWTAAAEPAFMDMDEGVVQQQQQQQQEQQQHQQPNLQRIRFGRAACAIRGALGMVTSSQAASRRIPRHNADQQSAGFSPLFGTNRSQLDPAEAPAPPVAAADPTPKATDEPNAADARFAGTSRRRNGRRRYKCHR